MARKRSGGFQKWFPEKRKFGGVWYSLYATSEPKYKKDLEEKARELRKGGILDPQDWTRIVYDELPPVGGINPVTGREYPGIEAYLLYVRKKPETSESKAFRRRIQKIEQRKSPWDKLLGR